MSDCFIVQGCCGHAEEWCTWPVRVFLDKKKADQYCTKLNTAVDPLNKLAKNTTGAEFTKQRLKIDQLDPKVKDYTGPGARWRTLPVTYSVEGPFPFGEES